MHTNIAVLPHQATKEIPESGHIRSPADSGLLCTLASSVDAVGNEGAFRLLHCRTGSLCECQHGHLPLHPAFHALHPLQPASPALGTAPTPSHRLHRCVFLLPSRARPLPNYSLAEQLPHTAGHGSGNFGAVSDAFEAGGGAVCEGKQVLEGTVACAIRPARCNFRLEGPWFKLDNNSAFEGKRTAWQSIAPIVLQADCISRYTNNMQKSLVLVDS